MLTTLTKAQGYTDVPAESEGMVEGAQLPVTLLRTRQELEQTLVVVGSHDNTLDLLANELMDRSDPIRLASTHVGSMGGLRAIKNGSALVAGTHLFDPASGDYNFPFIDKYLPDISVQLVNLAIRHQGLLVPKGNPKSIQGVRDLLRDDIRFINRQRGAGTRILFDYHLCKENITPDQVLGYENEEYTHMAVAVNVLSGTADCGMASTPLPRPWTWISSPWQRSGTTCFSARIRRIPSWMCCWLCCATRAFRNALQLLEAMKPC